MELKRYQNEALSVLRRFFEEARVAGAKQAYEAITGEPEQAERLGRYGGSYAAPLKDLPDVPYVCLRLPTGGGKTILAAHAVAVARDAWVEKDFPLVLWLVPTNIIRSQTAEALKNTRHPYRRALDEAFDGRVRIFDIADFAQIRPHDLREHCCIVVGTIQTLRVSNTEGRKVYAHNENLEPHFSGAIRRTPGLDRFENNRIKFSFANLMHWHRPLMIVDEAHNAVTGLTREMQMRVNPCAIVEFTATPRDRSNILFGATAQELKNEEMIKLPIRLSEHNTWQEAVNGALVERAFLAETTARGADYIRPIVLFQAQKRDQEVTVEVLKKYLTEDEGVPDEKIAVATGDQRELDGIDLFDPQCPVECVITVEALKEGWDCSFAYVFCSVSRIQSAQAVEQLLGRVLRMPYAKRREAAELNRAYAFVSEPVAGEAARALVDKLVSMGFEEDEASENVEPVQGDLDGGEGLFGIRERPKPEFRHVVEGEPETLTALGGMDGEGLEVRELDHGKVEIVLTGHVSEERERTIREVLPERERQDFTRGVAQYRSEIEARLSPAERGEKLDVPRLMSEIQGSLELADADVFMEHHDWSLLNHSPNMDEVEFSTRRVERIYDVDVRGGQLGYQFVNEEQGDLPWGIDATGRSRDDLVRWLDRNIRQSDISQAELLKWLGDLVDYLINERSIAIFVLMRFKFFLARSIHDKIAGIRKREREGVYQRHLFDPGAKPVVSFDHAFSFKEGMYHGERRYRDHWRPSKHFLGPDDVPAFDGAENGEEFQCARAIDEQSGVKYWIRNVARHPASFWLPTATDKFYPDFVAQLDDGRLFVIEYKGARDADSRDTKEKRLIGNLWEEKSSGKGLFLIVEKERNGLDVRGQISAKIKRRT